MAERVEELLAICRRGVRDLSEGVRRRFDGSLLQYKGNRFHRFRFWIVLVLALDVLVSTGAFFAMAEQEHDFRVWYQQGFPIDLVGVNNDSGDDLRDLTLELDGSYRAVDVELRIGSNSFRLLDDFRDARGFGPPNGYRPSQLEVFQGGELLDKVRVVHRK